MTMEVRLRPEAEHDLAESAAWYEQQRTGLGRNSWTRHSPHFLQ